MYEGAPVSTDAPRCDECLQGQERNDGEQELVGQVVDVGPGVHGCRPLCVARQSSGQGQNGAGQEIGTDAAVFIADDLEGGQTALPVGA